MNTTLPTKHNEMISGQLKSYLERMGVKFLSPVEGEPMFQHVELPEGWRVETTHEVYHSNLVDNLGRNRASIFCKGAIWDRKAYISPTCRYSCAYDEERHRKEGEVVVHVKDGNTIIHSTTPIACKLVVDDIPVPCSSWSPSPEAQASTKAIYDTAYPAAKDWLNGKYPDWENPYAYWE